MLSYSSDSAAKMPTDDRFDRWEFAKRIAEIVINRRDPHSIAIGIYGAWGDGKTSVLNFIRTVLAQHQQSVHTFNFNPWRFPDEETLLRNFFLELGSLLGIELVTKREKFGARVKKYGRVIASVLDRQGAAEEVANLFGEADLLELRLRIEKALEDSNHQVVVIMDDIDRLDEGEIFALFRLVKLTADFKHTAYILAFDHEVVANVLQTRYGQSTATGRGFLEKIIQIPLHLPSPGIARLRKYCFEAVAQAVHDAGVTISDIQWQEFHWRFVEGLEIRLRTPRMVNLYTNALSFALPMLEGEVNVVDLLLMEGLRIFYPTIYEVVRNNPGYVIGDSFRYAMYIQKEREAASSVFGEQLVKLSKNEEIAVKNLLLYLFPSLGVVFENANFNPNIADMLESRQRVGSASYFTRYFSYSVPTGDIPDQELIRLLDLANQLPSNVIRENIVRMLKNGEAETFLRKLDATIPSLENSKAPEVLIEAIMHLGDLFDSDTAEMLGLSTRGMAAFVVRRLLSRVPAARRHKIAQNFVLNAKPLLFAVTCYSWMKTSGDSEEDKRLISNSHESDIGKTLARRIASEASESNNGAKDPLFVTYGKTASAMLDIWREFTNQPETEEYIVNLLTLDPCLSSQLIWCYLPTVRSSDRVNPYDGEFTIEQYDRLAAVVDLNKVSEAVNKCHNNIELPEYFPNKYIEPYEMKPIHQFLMIHANPEEFRAQNTV